MDRKLVLIRHADTTAPHNTLVGKNDLPLSEKGIEDAARLKTGIHVGAGIKIYCSGLKRASQTAEILFPRTEMKVDERLNEIDFGIWSGLRMDQILEKYPEDVNKWCSNPMSFSFPSGESVPEFISRIENFINEVVVNTTGTIALVCHGGVIRFMLCRMLNLDYQHHLAFEIRKPSVNLVDHDGKHGALSGLNLTQLTL